MLARLGNAGSLAELEIRSQEPDVLIAIVTLAFGQPITNKINDMEVQKVLKILDQALEQLLHYSCRRQNQWTKQVRQS